MKTLKGITIALICLMTTSVFAQQTIADVTLPATQTIEGADLTLNGGGLREKLWIDLYVGGLYVTTKTSDAKAVMNADVIYYSATLPRHVNINDLVIMPTAQATLVHVRKEK